MARLELPKAGTEGGRYRVSLSLGERLWRRRCFCGSICQTDEISKEHQTGISTLEEHGGDFVCCRLLTVNVEGLSLCIVAEGATS